VAQRRSAGEGQIEVEAVEHLRREIFEVAALELGEGHRRVDVVEGGDSARDALDELADGDA